MSREKGLGLYELRKANLERCEKSFHPIDDWSPTDWACALAGEVGELCNLIKKQRRGEFIPSRDLHDEIGDVMAYLDLLAASLYIDLSEATKIKFNYVSERIGSDVKL